MAGPSSGDISQAAAGNAALQSQIAASTAAQTKDDPSDIFELLTACFDHAVAFVGKAAPGFMKVSGLVSTGIDAHVKPEAAAPIKSGGMMMPGSMAAQGGALAKGLGKVFNFKNLLNGLSAPNIEALAQMEGTMLNVSWSDLGGLSPQSFAGGGIDMGRSSGVEMA